MAVSRMEQRWKAQFCSSRQALIAPHLLRRTKSGAGIVGEEDEVEDVAVEGVWSPRVEDSLLKSAFGCVPTHD